MEIIENGIQKNEKQDSVEAKIKLLFSVFLKICPIILSLIALLYSTAPQLFFAHSNYLKKAEAGHVKSQMFLADHYYEVGDISESIYWYKIASMHNGEYQARALNNLAVLYSRQDTINAYELSYYKCLEVELFKQVVEHRQASEENKLTAAKNMYYTLVSLPDNVFTRIEYDNELQWVKDFLCERGEFTKELSKYEDNWVYEGTTSSLELVEEGLELREHKVAVGIKTVHTDGGGVQVQTVYETRYDVYRKKTPEEIPDLEMLFSE